MPPLVQSLIMTPLVPHSGSQPSCLCCHMSSHQHQVQQYIACLLYTARNSILNALSISLYMVVAGPFAHDMLNPTSSWPYCLHVLALHFIASQTCCHQSVQALGALCLDAHLPCQDLALPVAGSLQDGTPTEKPMLSITSTAFMPRNFQVFLLFKLPMCAMAASDLYVVPMHQSCCDDS